MLESQLSLMPPDSNHSLAASPVLDATQLFKNIY